MDDSNTSAGAGADATPPAPARAADADAAGPADGNGDDAAGAGETNAAKRRRRGSRGGQNRKRPDGTTDSTVDGAATGSMEPEELPERMSEGRVTDPDAADKALVRKPKIGDTRAPFVPAMPPPGPAVVAKSAGAAAGAPAAKSASGHRKRRRGGGRARGDAPDTTAASVAPESAGDGQRKRRRAGRVKPPSTTAMDADLFEQRRGRERNGRPIGRYFMCVQVRSGMAQVAVLEGRSLIEHYVSRPADDVSQIHGNIYLGRVQNVLPGMEAAFVDVGTPKNAVLYRGDVQYDEEDVESGSGPARIEHLLRPRQSVVVQVTKNPIGSKGARLTQEVSLPGRFVVLIPNSK